MTLVSLEHLTADADRVGPYHCEGDDARHRAVVHPVMDGAPLHQHVASLEAHAGAIELHVDLASRSSLKSTRGDNYNYR